MPVTINGTTGVIGPDGSASTPSYQGSDANTGMFFPAADTIAFAEGGAEVARFDSLGNFGLGVTPSAWVGGQAVQIGARAGSFYRTDLTSTELSNNSYFNSGVGYVYQASAAATLYRQASGVHSWFYASSGTAGNTTNYTEAARIDSSGRLLVGTTSAPSQTGGVVVANNELFVSNIPTTASGANCHISSGEGNRFYRSTSALKYKQDIRDIESIDIGKFRPVRYKSKCENDDQTKDHFGFIADEAAAEGFEELVTRGADGEVEGFQYDRMTVVLVKAIQEQQALIAALQADVAALKGAQA